MYPRYVKCTHDINMNPRRQYTCIHDIIFSSTTSLCYPRHHDMLTYRGYISWGTFLMSWGTFASMYPRHQNIPHDIIMYPRHHSCLAYIWNVSHDMVPTISKCYPRHLNKWYPRHGVQDIIISCVHLIDVVGTLMSWVPLLMPWGVSDLAM